MKLGKLEDAETAILKGIEILKPFGETHQELYKLYWVLAEGYFLQDRLSEAEQFYITAINGLSSLSGEFLDSLIFSSIRLSVIYKSQKRYSEAVGVAKSAIDLIERNLGKCHNILVVSYQNLAEIYFQQEKWSESEVAYSMYELLHVERSEKPLELSACYKQLAAALTNQGKLVNAETAIVKGIGILEQHFGETHHTLPFYHYLAYLYDLKDEFLRQKLFILELSTR